MIVRNYKVWPIVSERVWKLTRILLCSLLCLAEGGVLLSRSGSGRDSDKCTRC